MQHAHKDMPTTVRENAEAREAAKEISEILDRIGFRQNKFFRNIYWPVASATYTKTSNDIALALYNFTIS